MGKGEEGGGRGERGGGEGGEGENGRKMTLVLTPSGDTARSDEVAPAPRAARQARGLRDEEGDRPAKAAAVVARS